MFSAFVELHAVAAQARGAELPLQVLKRGRMNTDCLAPARVIFIAEKIHLAARAFADQADFIFNPGALRLSGYSMSGSAFLH